MNIETKLALVESSQRIVGITEGSLYVSMSNHSLVGSSGYLNKTNYRH